MLPTNVLTFVLLAATVPPQGEAESLPWDRKSAGHKLTADGLTFVADGPTALIFEVRGDKSLARKPVQLVITRDEAFASTNTLTLKRKGRGPRGYPLLAKVGVKVPDGSHRYRLTADAELVVRTNSAKRVAPRLAAAEEQALPSPMPVAALAGEASSEGAQAPPQPETEPETETALEEENADANADADAAPAPASDGAEATAVADSEVGVEASVDEVEVLRASASNEAMVQSLGGDDTEAAAGGGADSAQSAALQRALRVAVYNLELQGIEPTIGAVVTDSLIAEIRKLQAVSAIGMDEIEDMLSHEANKQLLGCEADDSCLAEIAGALGVDNLITGSLSKAADSHVFVARRIDQMRAAVSGTSNKRLKAGSGQEFLLAVGPVVEELFPDRSLRSGTKRGVAKEVALRLDPPPLPTWSFWTVAGTAAATAAVGSLFGLLARTAQDDYNSFANLSLTQVVPGATLNEKGGRVETNAMAANVLWISAGALAVTAGIMFLFTDWDGYGESGVD